MRLYTSIGPNPRIVTLCVALKGIAIETVTVDIMAGENRRPAYLARNPAAGTPLLELDDGGTIAESIAICEYLEELYPAPPLIGTTPEERAATRMWVRRIDLGYVQPMIHGFRGSQGLALFKDRVRCVPEGADGMKAVAAEGLAFVDVQLGDGPFLCGARMTLADLLLLSFVDFGAMVGQPPDPAFANVAAWHARIAAHVGSA